MNSALPRRLTERLDAIRWLGALVLIAACGTPRASPTLGTNSNWLVACADDGECTGAASCECARCTRTCEADADCSAVGNARCVLAATPAALSQCGVDSESAGICLRGCAAGECAESEACIEGACVTNAMPDNDFCAAVPASTNELRADEDELFELVQAMRAAGGVTCGSSAASTPASTPVGADGRLRCAARALAADIDSEGTRGLVDSSGRNTRDRLQAAGYAATLWAEGYAIASRTPNDALGVILTDESACSGLTRDGYTALGVAHVGNAYVVTLGAP